MQIFFLKLTALVTRLNEYIDIKLCGRCNDISKQYRLLFELNRINIFFSLFNIKDEVKNVLFFFYFLVVAILCKAATLDKVRGKENF